MKENTYNGWTNYATWRVNLEIFDGTTLVDMSWDDCLEPYKLGEYCKDYAEEVIFMDSSNGLLESYARAFISDVNWYEIAEHLIENHKQEESCN
jgi:hypothetical protein